MGTIIYYTTESAGDVVDVMNTLRKKFKKDRVIRQKPGDFRSPIPDTSQVYLSEEYAAIRLAYEAIGIQVDVYKASILSSKSAMSADRLEGDAEKGSIDKPEDSDGDVSKE